jgi:hypothetical protein
MRNRNRNTEIVGIEAATYAARCVAWGALMTLLAVAWIAVYVFAAVTRDSDLSRVSVAVLLLFGLPMVLLAYRANFTAARLAADHFEAELGFRPRWWTCYSAPRGWIAAINRQKSWHARGRWPLIPW